ncbi:hypothetical protein NW762_011305 [Fusarium torreyae]|uniref:Uncharacterized protein n=1 Tax=Fusarium torreyae TaxID=1237075 RepID=A0A9W8RRS9_9HYPO|nr:hypothetical protein NW762_011305 [Fusarium torreyae]
MCQFSSTASICEQCRRLVVYKSDETLCLKMRQHLLAGGEEPEERECLEEPKEETQYVHQDECKKCNPPNEDLA